MERGGQWTELRRGPTPSGDEPAMSASSADGPSALPQGTVTFLLTDVERSTRAWTADPSAMAAAIARHGELLAAAVSGHGGVRPTEQGEGDSIVAAFPRATDALRAAIEAQRLLAAEAWPTAEPLKVRMAVHTGEARLRDATNYAGTTIIRAARLRAIAHGGQVLVSSATRDIALDELDPEVDLVDLGMHRLKDLSRPERVWQLVHPELQSAFPPLRSLDAVPNNLPLALSSFVGRFDDIDTVSRLVVSNRLVTITGPGGAGKTRLAQRVAAEMADGFPDGVWWVDLLEVTDPDLIASAISRAATVPEDRADRLAGVARRLASTRTLVVLDNCEHLLDACAGVVRTLLTAGAEVAVLATSRAPLNVPGEVSWRLPPLSLLPADQSPSVGAAAQSDAVRLFAERAAMVRQDFRLTDGNVADVAAICARLDGIPLALELAAAHCRALSPTQINDQLGDLLGSTQRGVPARHQTMEASIRWSYSLLSSEQQSVLRRVAVFAGPFTLGAARAVVADDSLAVTTVLPALEALVDHSLVQAEPHADETTFRVLETVRQFGTALQRETGESDELTARHARYFAERARGLWPLFGPDMGELLEQADLEFADLVQMLEHLAAHASPEEHIAVAMACLPAISVRHVAEAASLGEKVEARVDPLSVLGGRLHLQLALVDPTLARHVELGVAAAEATGDPDLTAYARFWAAWESAAGDPTRETIATLVAALGGLADIGEEHFSHSWWSLVGIERAVGLYDDAAGHWERARAETVCKRCNVMVWSEGALLALARGDLDAARQAAARAGALGREVRDAGFQGHVRLTEVALALYAGEAWPRTEVEGELDHGLTTGHPMVLGYLSEARGAARLAESDLAGADEDLGRAIELLDGAFSRRTEASLRRAAIAHARGGHARAADLVAELRAQAGHWDAGPWLLSQIDHRAAALAFDDGDLARADELAHRALSDAWLGPWPPLVVTALEILACVAAARESTTEAARLLGAAARARNDTGFRLDAEPERTRTASAAATVRQELGKDDFDRAFDEGTRLGLDEAVAYARRARGERKRPSHGWDGLTPTERQVAELAIAGLTNAQIAERLFVGAQTVKTHLSNVYAKVGVANRTQLVGDAARRGITY
jgi:predicted ATPase/class 3 adenylate cyclase/DNA-binding CsgD family transcriptional regulator